MKTTSMNLALIIFVGLLVILNYYFDDEQTNTDNQLLELIQKNMQADSLIIDCLYKLTDVESLIVPIDTLK